MSDEFNIQKFAQMIDGKIEEVVITPDGTGFATMSFPLPKDHWIYKDDSFNVPPMALRMYSNEVININLSNRNISLSKEAFSKVITEAGKYAVRCATMNGKEMDFDPDALLQNLVTAFVGYHTETGLSSDEWANPKELK